MNTQRRGPLYRFQAQGTIWADEPRPLIRPEAWALARKEWLLVPLSAAVLFLAGLALLVVSG